MKPIFCCDPALFWNGLTAVSTLLLFIVTGFLVYYGKDQLKQITSTSKVTFLHELKKDFFTEKAREILSLIQHNLLEFKVYEFEKEDLEIGKFELKKGNPEIPKLLKIPPQQDFGYTTFEMDDFLLVHLEDLGQLFDDKEIDINNAVQAFGYYIEEIWENAEINKYIMWARTEDPDIYSKFELIYVAVKNYDAATQAKIC